MGSSRLDPNGETASLKKRKRQEQRDDATAQLRKKSKSKQAATGSNDSNTQSDLTPVRNTNRDVELAGSSALQTTRDAEPAWKVSKPMGGRILDIDPIFSVDER